VTGETLICSAFVCSLSPCGGEPSANGQVLRESGALGVSRSAGRNEGQLRLPKRMAHSGIATHRDIARNISAFTDV
jgi:hypothetical protein